MTNNIEPVISYFENVTNMDCKPFRRFYNRLTCHRFSYDDGTFTPLTWLGRLWRHISGKGFIEDCDPLYIFYQLVEQYKKDPTTDASLKGRILASIKSHSWFDDVSECGEPDSKGMRFDVVSGISDMDNNIASMEACTEIRDADKSDRINSAYDNRKKELMVCKSGNLCRVTKVMEIRNRSLASSLNPFKYFWRATSNKYQELLGFSNGKFYRVTPLEQFFRRITFRGFSDCQRTYLKSVLAVQKCENHGNIILEKILK